MSTPAQSAWTKFVDPSALSTPPALAGPGVSSPIAAISLRGTPTPATAAATPAAIVIVCSSAAWAQEAAAAVPAEPDSRLFFGATARSLPAGQGYFSVRELGLPAFQVGITDRFSIGAATPIALPGKVMFFSPKY